MENKGELENVEGADRASGGLPVNKPREPANERLPAAPDQPALPRLATGTPDALPWLYIQLDRASSYLYQILAAK